MPNAVANGKRSCTISRSYRSGPTESVHRTSPHLIAENPIMSRRISKQHVQTPAAPKGAVLYVRVSSKEQEKEGFSIPAQRKLLRGYADEHGFTIVKEFEDVETAKRTGRTGFGEMVDFLEDQPTCQIILVEKTDRLYRNIRDWVTIADL